MKRICFLGNSHIAALKLGWDEFGQRAANYTPTFFAARKNKLKDLEPQGRSLVPDNDELRLLMGQYSGGHETIAVDDYDAFVISGLYLSLQRIVYQLYAQYRSEQHRNTKGMKQLISASMFDAAAVGLMGETPAMTLATKLASLTDAPILVSPQPMPSELIPTVMPMWAEIAQAGDDEPLAATFADALGKLKLPGSVQIRRQPAQTLARPPYSKREYSVGSVRLSENFDIHHPEEDNFHMNADYGVAVLTDLLDVIEAG